MKKVLIFVFIAIICLIFIGRISSENGTDNTTTTNAEQQIELNENNTESAVSEDDLTTESSVEKITMPKASYYYTGHERPVGRIVAELEELGFTNIKTVEVEEGIYYFSVEELKIYPSEGSEGEHFDEGDVFNADSLIEVYYYGGPLEDGMIQETNIFEIEKKIKNSTGYVWSNDHSVIEGRTGYFGTLYCEEQDIWCDLYGNDLEEITTAKISVSKADFEFLITFASFFDTSLINSDDVIEWLKNYSSQDDYSKVFGDADFSLYYDETYTLYITALE